MDSELRKRFNPDGSLLRRQQLRMLELLEVIDVICRKHQIPYWLSSGTLIGAARHKGFIPWDDDLDIEMLRSDYLRLLKVLPQELPDNLALQTNETDPNYIFIYGKLRDKDSHLEETNSYDRISIIPVSTLIFSFRKDPLLSSLDRRPHARADIQSVE